MTNHNPNTSPVSEDVFNGLMGEIYERIGLLEGRSDDADRIIAEQALELASLRSLV